MMNSRSSFQTQNKKTKGMSGQKNMGVWLREREYIILYEIKDTWQKRWNNKNLRIAVQQHFPYYMRTLRLCYVCQNTYA